MTDTDNEVLEPGIRIDDLLERVNKLFDGEDVFIVKTCLEIVYAQILIYFYDNMRKHEEQKIKDFLKEVLDVFQKTTLEYHRKSQAIVKEHGCEQ